MQSRTRSNFAEPKPLLAPELVYRCKITKFINALQAFFQFIPNYFLFSHSLIFVKIIWLSHRPRESIICEICEICVTSFCRAKYFRVFCVFCVTIKQSVKQFRSPHFVLKFPFFSLFQSPGLSLGETPTFPYGNSNFPLTKLSVSPRHSPRPDFLPLFCKDFSFVACIILTQ